MQIARPVTGHFRHVKNSFNTILFTFFFLAPYIRFGSERLIFLDIPARKFHLFGLTIWPQELFYLQLVLLLAGVTLFFVTSLFGRIWCSYACPQTLFIELFNLVGSIVAGKKFGKKTQTIMSKVKVWIAWVFLSLFIGFTFILYFKQPEEVFSAIFSGNIISESGLATWFLFSLAASVFSLAAFGWFRENACKYVCPYGRFQTVMLDEHSPIIQYDPVRGEPRRQKGQKKGEGLCTSCNMCQLVCPTEIDIREGLQVGCIRCGLCADACTIEMSKHEEETLISLSTMAQLKNPNAKPNYLRPRTVVYGMLFLIVSFTLAFSIIKRKPFIANTIKDKVSSFFIPGMGYRNSYQVHLGNKSNDRKQLEVSIKEKDYELMGGSIRVEMGSAAYETLRVLVVKKEEKPKQGTTTIHFIVKDEEGVQTEIPTSFSTEIRR